MDKTQVAVVGIRYLEPEWEETKECLVAAVDLNRQGDSGESPLPIHYIDRCPPGTGSLAEALNRGFSSLITQHPSLSYIWFVTNVTFTPDLLPQLVEAMGANPDYAAIHPCFASDHLFCRPNSSLVTRHSSLSPAPFVEFTAPIVRASVFAKFPLDESMPYWGHDLDWGYRVWQAGHKVGVLQSPGPLLGHTYVRFLDNGNGTSPVTRQRHALRRSTNNATRYQLQQKYGPFYRQLIFPQTEQEIERWKERLSQPCFNSRQFA
jgi:hypothetical protein